MDYKVVLGFIAAFIGVMAYAPYCRDIVKGKTKPHIFSWFVWGLNGMIAFFAQTAGGGGAGAWNIGVTGLVCLLIAFASFFRGEKTITRIDWLCFIGALVGALSWHLTSNPLTAIIILTISDVLAFVPTYRKSYHKPHDETEILYSVAALTYIISLPALTEFNLTTALYPAALFVANICFITLVRVRKKIVV